MVENDLRLRRLFHLLRGFMWSLNLYLCKQMAAETMVLPVPSYRQYKCLGTCSPSGCVPFSCRIECHFFGTSMFCNLLFGLYDTI